MPLSATSLPSLSVNEVLRRWPGAIAALNAAGIDSCCGGALSLADAAAEAGIPVGALLAAIEKAKPAEDAR